MIVLPATSEAIARAAVFLRDGKLVAFPTETVYGLGAIATSDAAVASVYAAKGRPQFNPLIIHVADPRALDQLIEWNDRAHLVAAQFWPGPLTLVLPRKKDCPVSLLASAGMNTLAVRVPAHVVAQQLLRAVGLPVAAPSANASGKLSPTTPSHVAESLHDKVDMILAGGRTQVGLESTVLNLTSEIPVILRPGGITQEQLAKVLGVMPAADCSTAEQHLSPGMLAAHYAPNLPLRLNVTSVADGEALLGFGPDILVKGGVLRLNLSESGDVNQAAANLFAMLRQLDQPQFRGIAVMPIPNAGLGVAINDRLRRAATR